MTQRDLNRAVANVTGETVETIERMGFGPLSETVDGFDPRMMGWGEADDSRFATQQSRFATQQVRRRRLTVVE